MILPHHKHNFHYSIQISSHSVHSSDLSFQIFSKSSQFAAKNMKRTFTFAILFCLTSSFSALFLSVAHAQETKPTPTIKFNPFDGIIVAGYVDNGAFLNFTGPSISLTIKSSKILLGMLPSLRYKEDHGIFKNSPITPNLGFGLTYCYRKMAIQVPLYYNAKTSTTNGRWNIGIGIGMRLKYK